MVKEKTKLIDKPEEFDKEIDDITFIILNYNIKNQKDRNSFIQIETSNEDLVLVVFLLTHHGIDSLEKGCHEFRINVLHCK